MQVSGEKEFFAEMVVEAVSRLDPATLDMNMLGTKKVQGGGLRDSFLVDGVAFKKTFSYAGFEMQPKSYKDPKVLLLNIELELKSEKENAEVRCNSPACLAKIPSKAPGSTGKEVLSAVHPCLMFERRRCIAVRTC